MLKTKESNEQKQKRGIASRRIHDGLRRMRQRSCEKKMCRPAKVSYLYKEVMAGTAFGDSSPVLIRGGMRVTRHEKDTIGDKIRKSYERDRFTRRIQKVGSRKQMWGGGGGDGDTSTVQDMKENRRCASLCCYLWGHHMHRQLRYPY